MTFVNSMMFVNSTMCAIPIITPTRVRSAVRARTCPYCGGGQAFIRRALGHRRREAWVGGGRPGFIACETPARRASRRAGGQLGWWRFAVALESMLMAHADAA